MDLGVYTFQSREEVVRVGIVENMSLYVGPARLGGYRGVIDGLEDLKKIKVRRSELSWDAPTQT